MTSPIFKIKSVSMGWQGGPGYSQHFFSSPTTGDPTQADVDAAAAAVRAFWFASKNYYSINWHVDVKTDVEVLDATTGHLTGLMALSSTPATVAGSGGNYGPVTSGAAVTWRSNVVMGRRLARGRTFMTPLALNAYDTTGLLLTTACDVLKSAGQGLINDTASNLVIWHRPSKASPSGGAYTAALTASCSTEPVVLRSRRD